MFSSTTYAHSPALCCLIFIPLTQNAELAGYHPVFTLSICNEHERVSRCCGKRHAACHIIEHDWYGYKGRGRRIIGGLHRPLCHSCRMVPSHSPDLNPIGMYLFHQVPPVRLSRSSEPALGGDPPGHHLLTHQEHAWMLSGVYTGTRGPYTFESCNGCDEFHTTRMSLWFHFFDFHFKFDFEYNPPWVHWFWFPLTVLSFLFC